MASLERTPGPSQRRPRVRKSIATIPSSDTAQDQENMDQQNIDQTIGGTKRPNSLTKKSRSKSLGPGGLDALREGSGNRRKSVNSFQPKSILKPSIPLSPIRDIPARPSVKAGSPSKSPRSPNKRPNDDTEDRVSDTPVRGGSSESKENAAVEPMGSTDTMQNQTLEDPELAERRKRKAEIQKQREARRKSMAGRRVSFAPEATLHTWDTEVLQDSTSSTGSTETTRRASAFTQSQTSNGERPGTPPDKVEGNTSKRSPEHQRDAHKKKRRRSSGVPPMNFNDPDVLSSSPFGGASAVDDDFDSAAEGQVHSNASPTPRKASDSMLGDTSMQSIEEVDEDLDASLEDAAKRAGTRSLDVDENGDVSMEIAGDEVTAAFRPWVKQSMGTGSPHPGRAIARADQENVNPFSPTAAIERGSPTPSTNGEQDMSMDITQAIGGIVRPDQAQKVDQPGERYPRRRQSVRRRRSSGAGSELGDGTMELTKAMGGLQQSSNLQGVDPNQVDENEELSMEFTSVFGGLKGQSTSQISQSQPRQSQHPLHEEPEEKVDGDADMEMTEAIGSIAPTKQQTRSEARASKERETGGGEDEDEQVVESASSSLRGKSAPQPRPSVGASPRSSPAFNPFARRDRLRRSGDGPSAITPERKPGTPPHQVTPNPMDEKPSTPGKTPPSAQVAMRKTTPKKLFQKEIRAARSPLVSTPDLFVDGSRDSQQTPNVPFTPNTGDLKQRSGLGGRDDKPASPRVAAILDRRTSITENADMFVPKGTSHGVRFEDPRMMDAEVSRERDEDCRRESGQFIIEQEADGDMEEDNVTQNLKDLMQSMTPKKDKPKNRKSLAVGSAKGLLGKRPAELDNEDDNSPRRFKSASPVKKPRLRGPPTAQETMRSSRNGLQPLSSTSGNARPQTPNSGSSPFQKDITTPKSQGRFKDAEALPSAQKPVPTMGQTAPKEVERAEKDGTEDKLGLQDFLNLTNIRFMELNTTKRRPTVAPSTLKSSQDGPPLQEQDPSKRFEDSIAAGACTIPMLELFQHSCRELKNYISEGRGVVREIEAETLEENPPVFREYTTARPAERATMDNQFKNMKTNARLLSKATWYEWRMKLLDGLQDSLKETSSGLRSDDSALQSQLELIQSTLQSSQEKRAAFEKEKEILQARANELAGCDPEDLEVARQRLQVVSQDIQSQSHELEQKLEDVSELDEAIAAAKQARDQARADAKESQKEKEHHRGWSHSEVRAAQARIDELVKSSGWRVIAATGSQITLEHEGELLLSFDVASYLPAAQTSEYTKTSPNLALAFEPGKWRKQGAVHRDEPSTCQRFFLQFLRAHLHSLDPGRTHASVLLRAVASGWQLARSIEDHMKQLRLRIGITHSRIAGDEKLTIESDVLTPRSQSKAVVIFTIAVAATLGKVEGGVFASVYKAYGRDFNESEARRILQKRVSRVLKSGEAKNTGWVDAVEALKTWLSKQL